MANRASSPSSSSRLNTTSSSDAAFRSTTSSPLRGFTTTLRVDTEIIDLMNRRDELDTRRIELLKSQAEASTSLNTLLDGKGGINYHTERTRRNLHAAIAVARQMGYFKYYETPETTKREEAVIPARIKAIKNLQIELDENLAESLKVQNDIKRIHAQEPPPINTLVAWTGRYGRPEGKFSDNYRLTIKPSTRRMGGTKHFPAFPSIQSKLVFGRALK